MHRSKTTKYVFALAGGLLVVVLFTLSSFSAGRADASPAPVTASATTTIPAAGTSGTAQVSGSPATVGTDQAPTNAPDSAGYTSGSGTSQTPVTAVTPDNPQSPTSPSGSATTGGSTVSVNLGGLGKPSESITIIIALTLLAVAPSLLILLTSFTRIIIVLSLTRQALGLQNVPPNQMLAGLALFLSLFIMSPVIGQVDHQAVQPYMAGKITAEQAYTAAQAPIKTWMLKQIQPDDLSLFEKGAKPENASKVPMAAVVPAFALSEMRTAFIIGFVIFIPFLVIDLVVSSTLMSLGMMMLPPSLVSLPFKLLLFILVDGWALVVQSLLSSFH
jgi:flagellar biosynthetic protein FliP